MAQNIDDFNRGVALILAHLYARFPIPAMLKVAELDPHGDLLPEESERREARHAVYGAAVEFLRDEGYLRYTNHVGGRALFSHVVLTSKGLAALQKTPEAILTAPSKTIGDALIDVTHDLLKDSAKELIRQAIRMVLG